MTDCNETTHVFENMARPRDVAAVVVLVVVALFTDIASIVPWRKERYSDRKRERSDGRDESIGDSAGERSEKTRGPLHE
ncbi:hypothetical protein G9464_03075 [Halostella sp. JP-L12]|uniref:hypothetical protein n=1 Tax=Halostella sp. JP-L12 TaxID=2716716 RepID=UPI0014091346|nr:hypothetical protein [Halostella sp. JP-L12]NHN46581.1 hypothetical protein [Halostella sp. JP-L12]